MIDRVIFIGDPSRGAQSENIARLELLISPIIEHFGLSWSSQDTIINRKSDLRDWLSDWKGSLDDKRPALAIENFEGAAVIGFETPEKELSYLSHHGVPWVNLTIHPIRFLDDLYLDVTTSFPCDLSQHAVSLAAIHFAARSLKSRIGHINSQSSRKTLAIFGQTPIDKSIYFDGCFKRLDDYIVQLDELVKGHDRILFRPHPYLTDPEVDHVICDRYSAEVSKDDDVYRLLASGEIDTACAISSSIVTEAPFFGVSAFFLEPRARRFGLPIDYRSLIDDTSFWANGLTTRQQIVHPLRLANVIPHNFLRSLFSSWGYVTETERHAKRLISAEAKAQSADVNAKGAETKSQQATAKAEAAEAKAERAEAKAERAEAKAERAEAKAERAEAKAERAETQCHDLHQRTLAAERAASHWRALSIEWHERVTAIQSSTSWKITRPFRALKRAALGDFSPIERRGAEFLINGKQFLRPFLSTALQFVLSRPRLRNEFSRIIKKCPWLHKRLLRVAINTGVVYSGASLDSQYAFQSIPRDAFGSTYETLNPRAQRIYRKIKAAVDQNKRKN